MAFKLGCDGAAAANLMALTQHHTNTGAGTVVALPLPPSGDWLASANTCGNLVTYLGMLVEHRSCSGAPGAAEATSANPGQSDPSSNTAKPKEKNVKNAKTKAKAKAGCTQSVLNTSSVVGSFTYMGCVLSIP